MVSAAVLTDLADTLASLAAVPTPVRAAPGADRNGHDDVAWAEVRAAARERFAPLNHDSPPEAGRPGTLVTVAPQDDPEIRLEVRTDPEGSLLVTASFVAPTDGDWEVLYEGAAAEYDEGWDERTRNRIVFVTEAWVRAERLQDETVLTVRQARAQALAECGYAPERIGEILDLDAESIRAALEQVDERIESARATVELLG